MRLVKAVLAGFLLLALGAMWTNRGWLVDAYRADEPAASVRLSGVDLAFEPSAIEETPYRLPSAPDTRAVGRFSAFDAGVPVPTPAPSIRGGDAVLRGVVTGPDGPVPDAVVRIERHTEHGTISVDVSTDAAGEWVMAPLAGGRYRVRAWVPESLTMGRSEVRFVGDDEVASFDLALWGIEPAPTFEFVDGGPMYEGLPATVALFLGWPSIDAEGLVVTNPVIGAAVTVETTAQVEVVTPQPMVTGADGVVRVRLRCVPTTVAPVGSEDQPAVGPEAGPGPGGSLTARSDSVTATFALPGCLPNPGLVIPEPEPSPGPDNDPDPDPGAEPDPVVEPDAEPDQGDDPAGADSSTERSDA